MTFLKVTNVFRAGEGDFALKGISFSQPSGKKFVIAGETGSGKSTLLKLIAGLEDVDTGDIHFQGELVTGPKYNLVPGHPGISYLSQNFELPRFLRVEQILDYANTLTDETANTLYTICQISHLVKRKTDQLSGGERQRIAIARLLITSPKLLLLDEPFTHLDMVHKNTLKQVINDIGERLSITCVLVSHDPNDTLPWADKIIVMKEGKLVQSGTPETIYGSPVNEYVAGLFGRYQLLDVDQSMILQKAFGIKPVKKRLLVRPESFDPGATGKKTARGKIMDVKFYGSYAALQININNVHVSVNTTASGMRPGKSVSIAIRKDRMSFVK